MNGTEWTEPGQGATVGELWLAVLQRGPGDEVKNAAAAMRFRKSRRLQIKDDCNEQTDLRLTGAPLTAADVKRIAEAK